MVANEKIIREQRNEILQMKAALFNLSELSVTQAAPQQNLPVAAAAIAQAQNVHDGGIDADATIVLPNSRQHIYREATVVFDVMDIL